MPAGDVSMTFTIPGSALPVVLVSGGSPGTASQLKPGAAQPAAARPASGGTPGKAV